jgi:hypothetical protein
MTNLSIIIVNYKSAGLVLDCLKTVYAETTAISFEVIVVDNQSNDGSREIVLRAFPGVKWIDMSYNAGFARANNAGIRQAAGESVLLLNADTLIKNKGIEKCYQQFAGSKYIACGVQLQNTDGSPQISGNYFMKGGLNYLLPLPYFGDFVKSIGNIFKVKKPNVPDADATIEVDWVNGAFLMVKKMAVAKAGLLDEDFFLYSEESEWCYRLRKEGPIAIFGDIKVTHLQGETTAKFFNSAGKGYSNLFDRKGLQITLSMFVRLRKQFGTGWFFVNLFFYLIDIPVFFVFLLLSTLLFWRKPAYTFSQFAGYCKNMMTILRFTPIILRNKPHFYKVL